ncbi:hypothetical protein, partial [Pseudomonas putida]|uniref:hypothetical protein n=1 Tax=Pseudomonas putida TaxID=303 RepID=UPI0019558486
ATVEIAGAALQPFRDTRPLPQGARQLLEFEQDSCSHAARIDLKPCAGPCGSWLAGDGLQSSPIVGADKHDPVGHITTAKKLQYSRIFLN